MKNICNLLFLFVLTNMLFLNCSDSNADQNEEENMEVEDISTLSADTEFNDVVDQLLEISKQVTDHATVQSLSNKQEDLTDEEENQLAIALGFNDLDDKKAAQESFREKWESVVVRYRLVEIEKDVFTEIIVGLYDEKYNQANTITKVNQNNTKMDEACVEARFECLNRSYESFYDLTGIYCVDAAPLLICGGRDEGPGRWPTDRELDSFYSLISLCDFNYECCLIGYDSIECALIF